MIKIPKDKHNEMMSKIFVQNEIDAMLAWLDPKISGRSSHLDMWKTLVKLYLGLPEGKITKILLYQILVINGIIDDGIHNRRFCSNKKNCPIVNEMMSKHKDIFVNDVCENLNLCLLIPYLQIMPPFNLITTDYVELDDSIIK